MKVGVLTGGGDCPGLNAAIRAVVRTGINEHCMEFIGIRDGWKGLIDGDTMPLDRDCMGGLIVKGGTILGSTPSNVFKRDIKTRDLVGGYERLGLDALIVIGGDCTLSAANDMSEAGANIVGIPKTIDNDIVGTERTIGFDTALHVAVEAIDRVHTTAESHHRVMIVEVMGRNAGWIAVMSGIAGGADIILIPEKPFDINEVCGIIRKRHERRNFTIMVVAEGAHEKGKEAITKEEEEDAFGYHTLGGVGYWLKNEIRRITGFDTRAIILGHTQRGGIPTVSDRILATRFGVKAVELVSEGKFGLMVGLKCDEIVTVPLKDAVKEKRVDDYWYELAEKFFG
ncbi:MAG: ATP-dependent 6-phosphofructokinase [Candidatus Altiarchaeota archaeon]